MAAPLPPHPDSLTHPIPGQRRRYRGQGTCTWETGVCPGLSPHVQRQVLLKQLLLIDFRERNVDLLLHLLMHSPAAPCTCPDRRWNPNLGVSGRSSNPLSCPAGHRAAPGERPACGRAGGRNGLSTPTARQPLRPGALGEAPAPLRHPAAQCRLRRGPGSGARKAGRDSGKRRAWLPTPALQPCPAVSRAPCWAPFGICEQSDGVCLRGCAKRCPH